MKRFSKSRGRWWKRIPKDVKLTKNENPKHLFSCIITDHKTGKRQMVSDLQGKIFIKVAETMEI